MQQPIVIAGAGLAGVSAALGLVDHGPVLLAGCESAESASEAAMTGLANPIMSRRANLVWRAEAALEALHAQAADVGAVAHHEGLLRTATDWPQVEAFRARAESHPHMARWFDAAETADRWPWLASTKGTMEILNGVSFDIPDLVSRSSRRLEARGGSVRNDWKLTGWTEEPDSVLARFESPEGPRTMSCGRLLLCMGAGILGLPAMDLLRLKLHPVKGQIIRVTPKALPDGVRVITGGPYMIPEGDDVIVGSSYEHQFEGTAPRREVSMQLLENAAAVLPFLGDARICSEHAGIRVTVPDTRLPMVGAVPGSNLVWVISGLGSKGLMSAPMIGKSLPDWLHRPDTVPSDFKIRLWKSGR